MQQLLITPNDVKTKARDVSQHVSEDKIQIYIEESENIDIKNALGDALFLDVKEHPENYTDLLNGTAYDTNCGDKRVFAGLKMALVYYAYARLMKNGDFNVNRYGTVNKTSEYSSNADYKEKVTSYNDAFSVADRYLKECVRYLNDCNDKYPLYQSNGRIKANRTIFRVIGE